ncbi:MAG: DUF3857 domain-containing protein [Phycisphaerae bacterium]
MRFKGTACALVFGVAAANGFADVGRLSLPADDALRRIEVLTGKLQERPNWPDGWTELAWLQYRYGQDCDGALESVQRACALAPASFKARELAGRLNYLRGRNDLALEHWLTLLDQDRPEVQLYIGAIGGLASSQSDRDRVAARLENVSAGHPNALCRTIARRLLAEYALARGDIERAERLFGEMGALDTWMIIGPFANERDAGYNTVYGPETEIDFEKAYQGRGHQVSWRPLEHLTFRRNIDFAAVCYPREQVLAYALTHVQAMSPQNATLQLGAAESIKVWFNDRLVYASELERRFALDQATIPVRLQRGANKLLVKVGVETGPWRLAVRLTDPKGRPLQDVRFTRKVDESTAPSKESDTSFVYTPTMMDHYARLADVDPTNEDALYYLGLAQQSKQLRTEASKTFERLARLNGRCADYHRLLARAYLGDDKAEMALAQMKRALQIDPGNLRVRMMLARFYNGRKLFKKEQAVLEEIAGQHPQWRELHFQWLDHFNDQGWEEPAFRKAKELYEAVPTNLRAAVTYARMCMGRGHMDQFDTLLEHVAELDFSNRFARRELLARALTTRRFDQALAQLDLMQRLDPLSRDLRFERTRLLMSLKRYHEAIEQCQRALEICPTDFAFHRDLGTIYQRMHDDASALTSLKTALEYRPDHRWLREYVEFLEPEENAAFARYAISDEQLEELIQRDVSRAGYPRSDSVLLLDELVAQLFDDGSTTFRLHQAVKVLDENGREQWTRVRLPNAANRVERAVVIQPDGSEVEAASMTNSSIHFAQLQPGSIVDFVVTGYAPANDWISREYSETFFLQSPDPMLVSRFVLLTPPSKPVNTWVQGDVVQYRTEEFQGQTVHIWEAHDVPRIREEPNRPPLIDLCAQVRVSTIGDWDDIARWEHSLIKEQFEADHDLRERARSLTAGLVNTRDKVRALANFVAQDIQYRIVRGGIFGYKPNKAANVLHNAWGDCKDKATLLITMLNVLDVDARYATLRTRDVGTLVEQIPSNQCNHAIVYVPDSGDGQGGLWVDGTALEHGIDALPWTDQDVAAMVWDQAGHMSLMRTPLEPPENTVSSMTFQVALRSDGRADVQGTWVTTGQIAAGLRSAFKQAGQRGERLTQLLNSFAPGSTLTDYTFSDLQNRDAPVEITMRFASSSYAVAGGDVMTLRFRRPIRATAQFAPRDVRYYDVWLSYCQKRRFVEIHQLPPGFTVDSVPDPITLRTPWMDYSASVEPDGKTLRVSRELVIKAVKVPRDRYDEFRRFCISLDEYEAQPIVLRRD